MNSMKKLILAGSMLSMLSAGAVSNISLGLGAAELGYLGYAVKAAYQKAARDFKKKQAANNPQATLSFVDFISDASLCKKYLPFGLMCTSAVATIGGIVLLESSEDNNVATPRQNQNPSNNQGSSQRQELRIQGNQSTSSNRSQQTQPTNRETRVEGNTTIVSQSSSQTHRTENSFTHSSSSTEMHFSGAKGKLIALCPARPTNGESAQCRSGDEYKKEANNIRAAGTQYVIEDEKINADFLDFVREERDIPHDVFQDLKYLVQNGELRDKVKKLIQEELEEPLNKRNFGSLQRYVFKRMQTEGQTIDVICIETDKKFSAEMIYRSRPTATTYAYTTKNIYSPVDKISMQGKRLDETLESFIEYTEQKLAGAKPKLRYTDAFSQEERAIVTEVKKMVTLEIAEEKDAQKQQAFKEQLATYFETHTLTSDMANHLDQWFTDGNLEWNIGETCFRELYAEKKAAVIPQAKALLTEEIRKETDRNKQEAFLRVMRTHVRNNCHMLSSEDADELDVWYKKEAPWWFMDNFFACERNYEILPLDF